MGKKKPEKKQSVTTRKHAENITGFITVLASLHKFLFATHSKVKPYAW